MKSEFTQFERITGLLTMNDVIRRVEAYDEKIDSNEPNNYFEYREHYNQSIAKRVLQLCTRPIYSGSMGPPQFLHNILGLTYVDLMGMDLKSIFEIEEKMDEITEYMSKEPELVAPED